MIPAELYDEKGQPVLLEMREVAPDTWAGRCLHTWNAAARLLSTWLGGQWWPGKQQCTWRLGRRSIRLHEIDRWPRVQEAAGCVESLGLAPAGPGRAPYSIGACARTLLQWVGRPQPVGRRCEFLKTPVGYMDCEPGAFSLASYHDVSSCYYQLMSRLPSLRVYVSGGELVFERMRSGEWERWRDVLGAVARHKELRSAIWGSARGSTGTRPVWIGGVKRDWRCELGPYHQAAGLVALAAWELTRRASEESQAVRSCVDSVIVRSGYDSPQIWRSVGLDSRVKHIGAGEVCAVEVCKVGEWESEPYKRGYRGARAMARLPAPEREWYREWL